MNITEYKNNIDALKMFDEMEVYGYIVSKEYKTDTKKMH